MYIERLQVESEGFLSGVDVQFSPGLNVIVGARGTGKTSLIELIRFCADADAFTDEAAARGRQQAIATLDGGAVTITVRDGDDRFEITRSASGHQTMTALRRFTCTVLAQNEIETVGAQGAGRLHLIDRFRPDREEVERASAAAESRLRSLTEEIDSLLRDVTAIANDIENFSSVPDELDEARRLQAQLLDSSAASQEQQADLSRLQGAAQVVSMRDSVLERDTGSIATFSRELERLRGQTIQLLEPWPAEAGKDPYGETRSLVQEISQQVDTAIELSRKLKSQVERATVATKDIRARIDEQSRTIRQALDAVQSGVGAASRKVAELEERNGRLEALRARTADRQARVDKVAAARDAAYRELEDIRSEVFAQRSRIADALNADLGPTVRVRVIQSDNVEAYKAAIVASLRGSGVHYNTLAPVLARQVSPFELAHWVERRDGESLAFALSINVDRAHSIIRAIRERGVADLIASEIEDGVALELLDGHDYKSTERLSIGQRCTAVLPVLLGHHGDPLVLDQPEDHLDNAFITSTLVPALGRRRPGDQFIFSSHNANIPVLGNADRVIVMQSDGERGRVDRQAALDDKEIVDAVSRLMEGGRQAFAARSDFYGAVDS